MSEYIAEGGPAFPNHAEYEDGQPVTGMTLRDYFAARAMQVFIANEETNWDQDVRDAYAVADKMLKQREVNRD